MRLLRQLGTAGALVILFASSAPDAMSSDSAFDFLVLDDRWLGKEFTAPELADLDGEVVDIAQLRGSVVVLNFWFMACPPCVNEIPKLNAVVDSYAEDGVAFFALTFDEEPELREFLGEHPFRYRVIPTTQDVLKGLGVEAYPSHMVIDREGRVIEVILGFDNGSRIERAIEQAIAGDGARSVASEDGSER